MKSVIRNCLRGVGLAALLAAGSSGPLHQNLISEAQAQPNGDVMVPWFEVDPFWPKPLPNHWVLAMTIGRLDGHP